MAASANDTAAFVARMLDSVHIATPLDTERELADVEEEDAEVVPADTGDPSVSAVRPVMRAAAPIALPSDTILEPISLTLLAAAAAELEPPAHAAPAPPSLELEGPPSAPARLSAIPTAPMTAPRVIVEDDAYYHPGGAIRSIAEAGWPGRSAVHVVKPMGSRMESPWLVLAVVALAAPILFVMAIVTVGRLAPAPAPDRAARVHTVSDQKLSLHTLGGDYHEHRAQPTRSTHARRVPRRH